MLLKFAVSVAMSDRMIDRDDWMREFVEKRLADMDASLPLLISEPFDSTPNPDSEWGCQTPEHEPLK